MNLINFIKNLLENNSKKQVEKVIEDAERGNRQD